MISTKVEAVYGISLPPDVHAFLRQLDEGGRDEIRVAVLPVLPAEIVGPHKSQRGRNAPSAPSPFEGTRTRFSSC